MNDKPVLPGQPAQRARRQRRTRRSVVLGERVARTLISIGGIGTILAVTLILAFLVWVVVPLFRGASASDPRRTDVDARDARIVGCGVDEYRLIGWTIDARGELLAHRLDRGELLERRALVEGQPPTAVGFDAERSALIFGFADGSVRLGSVGFRTTFVDLAQAPEGLRGLAVGEIGRHERALVERTGDGQLRFQEIEVVLAEPLATAATSPIVLVDRVATPGGETIATFEVGANDGRLRLSRVIERENLMTGDVTRALVEGSTPLAQRTQAPFEHLLISGGGANAYLASADGHCVRFDSRELDALGVAEELDLVPDPTARLTALGFMLGRTTLLAGDSTGELDAWFTTRPPDAGTRDGNRLTRAHALGSRGAAVSAIASSMRTRVVATGHADGSVRVFNVTSDKRLAELTTDDGGGASVRALCLSPKEDGLVALTERATWSWSLDLGHPEATLASLFAPVWYEGYDGPDHTWQATGGTDDFEPKLGLLPLVFGTLKATFYSLLFGVPLALLAAIFSSEFLRPRVRVPIKSTVEIMAGLPSVVLGFFAAIVIAPFVQDVVPAVLVAFATVPFALLLGAYLWQLLPQKVSLRVSDWQRFLAIVAMVPIGIALAARLGPWVERAVFAGDVKLWLAGERGNALGGWLLLFVPLSALVVAYLNGRFAMPWVRAISVAWSRGRCAGFDLARFASNVVATLALAFALAGLATALGFDARGSYVDTYVQRNALIVGFLMGFAIIPIIYTIAEDALSSVPEHLRLASLGAGATPWQTAVRVIVPTAASGLFSAVMVGLGRAVGETMIVLMATGNTAVMNWNVFSGFRTLSANIATELPEAVRDSTHYRTLFLAAFVLFALTFVVNTAAELVRQRFRKRAFQL